MNQIVEIWQINNRIDLYLIEAIAEENLKDVAASKGRTVGEQLAHIHNVRLMWIKESLPDLLNQVAKIEKENISKNLWLASFEKKRTSHFAIIRKSFDRRQNKGF